MQYKRANSEWIRDLKAGGEPEVQNQAHLDLSNYLYVVAFNALRNRQSTQNPFRLTEYTQEDLAYMAQDFVQDVLEKLVEDDYALLDKYSGKGKFTSWIAKIINNNIHHEFRKAHWRRAVSFPTLTDEDGNETDDFRQPVFHYEIDYASLNEPAKQALVEALQECLDQLSEMEWFIFEARVVKHMKSQELAKEIDEPVKFIFNTKFKAKKKLQDCLAQQGVSLKSTDIFEE